MKKTFIAFRFSKNDYKQCINEKGLKYLIQII